MRASVRRRIIRLGLVGVNMVILAVVAFLVLGHSDASTAPTTSKQDVSNAVAAPELSALDQLASASIAQTAAQMTGVGEIIPITNQADTERAQLDQVSIANDTLASKPQVVASTYKANNIVLYVVKSGDTMSKLVDKFGVSSESIRWSNSLSNDNISPGMKLYIPPNEGLVYRVKKGDTPASLALKYNVSKAKIVQYNDAELHGLQVGSLVFIPGATKTVIISTSYSSSSSSGGYRQPSYGYNGYDYGYCTWWVANERIKAGNPLPVGLGNASSWPYWAKVFGLSYGYSPRVGAAVVTSRSGEGHVAYVVQVDSDGSMWVSQMNSSGQRSMSDPTPVRGWNVVSYRHWDAGSANSFFYIY